MKKIYPLKGAVQNYAWGGQSYIPNLLNLQNADNQPFAEIWMGAHQRGPAQINVAGKVFQLNDWLENHPEDLGEKVIQKFGNRLPYLFKVLDVNKMLSIQSHPTKQAAEIGFAKENEAGIDLTARHRNYKDDNHKPEVMVAMTEFWLLHGFQTEEAIHEILKSKSAFEKVFNFFQKLKTDGVENILKDLYQYLMEMSQEEVDKILAPLGEQLQDDFSKNKIEKSNPDYWAALAFRDNVLEGGHFDRGIFSIYLFNLVHIKKGEGIFQDAGIPHAYLEGVNMELMANSDNVFRGGLTIKHIDVNELLQHMVFEPVIPNILTGEEIGPGVKVFKTPAPDFELTRIHLKDFQPYHCTNAVSPETLVVMEGEAIVINNSQEIRLSRGGAFFAPSGSDYQILADGKAIIFKATVA